jgi:hypothetical protein
MGVANPLEFAKEREIVKGQHKLDHGSYVPDPNFIPSEYPKWLYRDVKSKLVASEEEEMEYIEKGYVEEAPKQKVVKEDE